MSDGNDPRYAPPVAQVADVAPSEAVLAGRGTRLLAILVDVVALVAVYFVVQAMPGVAAQLEAESGQGSWSGITPLNAAFGFALFLLVQAWPLLTRGQTVGKIALKLRIERSDGSKPDAWRLLGLRYGTGFVMNLNPVVGFIYGLVDSLLIFREARQCLHDQIADTRVVQL
jgi:uncharacterized RDD family membrane protein YckC